MTKPDDLLSRELEIALKIEDNSVSVKTKSRAFSGLDRLLGSAFDIPAAYFEGLAEKKRLSTIIEMRFAKAKELLALRKIVSDPEDSTILINQVLEDATKKEINKVGVAVEAIEALKQLPPPNPNSGEDDEAVAPDRLDEDWMNQFTRFAEDASSEDLQRLWGRVLAGEIRKPRSFSRRTLRFISELDKETAEKCLRMSQFVIDINIVNNEKWNTGDNYSLSLFLQQIGLIEGAGSRNGPRNVIEIPDTGAVVYVGGAYSLLIQGMPGVTKDIPVFVLTEIGQEIMQLLPTPDVSKLLEELADGLDKNGIQKISIGGTLERSGGMVQLTDLRSIWVAN